MKKIVLCLCDITGNFAKPWLDAGYECLLIDPQHQKTDLSGKIKTVSNVIDSQESWAAIRQFFDRIAFVAAFPPCTDLAVSGARWFEEKRKRDPAFQFKAMEVVWQCRDIAEMLGVPYFIENPRSVISTFWRSPDHTFHPFNYTFYWPEDNYTKLTCLWAGCGFIMPGRLELLSLPRPDDRIHKAAPSPDRANFRSATPRGFSRAVFLSNNPTP